MTEGRTTHEPELPPVPDPRCITPAVEDYRAPRPALASLLWPTVWLAALVLLAILLTSGGWREEDLHHDETAPEHGRLDFEEPATEAPGHSESR